MKFSRSLTGALLACAMILSSTAVSAATYYNSYSSTDAVSYVKSRGFMTGYANGSFGENNLVNRAEFAKVITLIYSRTSPSTYTIKLPFRDTSNNAWYTPYIVYAYGNGFMSGYPDNTFHPSSAVTFSEAAKVLSMVYRLDLGDSSDDWYEPYVRALADEKAIPTSIYGFTQALTRGQLADIIHRLDSGDRSKSSLTYNDLDKGGSGGCDDIAVTIDPEDDEVRAGDTFEYEITIENCNDEDHSVDVEAELDHDMTLSSASHGGYSSGTRVVRWNDVRVDEDDEIVLTLRVRVQNSADDGDELDLIVDVEDDDGNDDSATETIEVNDDNDDNNDCYYDNYGRYICDDDDNDCSVDCYYDYSGRYICQNSNNCNNNNCYYDFNNNYICNNNNNNNCYYNSNGQYICNNNNSCGSNCYYDSRGRYVCTDNNNSSCNNCYYNSNGQYICDNNNGDVSVTLVPDTTQPGPGDTVRYTVRVRNNTSTDRTFTVRAQFSSDYTFTSGTSGVQITDSRNVYWNNINIDHFDTEELTLKLRVRNGAFDGERLDLYVTADNGNSRTDSESSFVYVRNTNSNNNNNCYYNSNGQYICNNNCYYNNYGQYVCNNSGNVSVLLRADSNSVRIGDIVRTYITINNNRNSDETVDLVANIDSNLTYYSSSNNPQSFNNSRVEWENLNVRANSTLTVTLDTRVSNFARVGDQLRINVTASSNSNNASDVEYINVRN